jgi:hypothetical protein
MAFRGMNQFRSEVLAVTTKNYVYTPPNEVFQFDDMREHLGVHDARGFTQPFAICETEQIARFVKDACNAEIRRRQEADDTEV